MARRRRIWTELLDPSALAEAGTIRLLARYQLEPLIAMTKARETAAMARALRALSTSGIRVGLWPLLDDAEGYWASLENVGPFAVRVPEALEFARRANAPAATVAIDLEPPVDVVRAFISKRRRVSAWTRSAIDAVSPRTAARRSLGTRRLGQMRDQLKDQGIETIAAVLPLLLLDGQRLRPWEAVLGTPHHEPAWDVVSVMFYTSIIRESVLPRTQRTARALSSLLARRLVHTHGRRAGASLGLVGTGKLEIEPVLPEPQALAADVSWARRAGIEDLALYSLEGVLASRQPERWLDAFAK